MLETIGNSNRVESAVQETVGLFQKGAGQNDNPGRSVPNFVVLRLRQFHHELGNLMFDFLKNV
jgi:hypothetical protein